jgi:hypothetical protein
MIRVGRFGTVTVPLAALIVTGKAEPLDAVLPVDVLEDEQAVSVAARAGSTSSKSERLMVSSCRVEG